MELEASSGILLLLMTVLSLIWANSPYADVQAHLVERFLFFINEGLMTFFFMLVGLELKRGYLEGNFNQPSQITLPLVAAILGMVFPALIYCFFTFQTPYLLNGWAIPVATDIAFAMGILSLFGKRVPFGLKLFLLSLAIFDDLGALLIIAFFYSSSLSWVGIFQTLALFGLLWLLSVLKVKTFLPYLIVGVFLWLVALQTGFHPTITGFLVAILLPGQGEDGYKGITDLEEKLHPWVSFFILPLFALANASISFKSVSWLTIQDPVFLGITCGLFLGKQLGVMTAVLLMVGFKWATLPEKTTWPMFYGVSILCGIGFTMSLFLGTLSFPNNLSYIAEVRLGVITGSVLSSLFGGIVLIMAFAKKSKRHRSSFF